ncbi:MAG: stage V sporulation protein AD [Clostridia bacterium]
MSVISFENPPIIKSFASIAGQKESKGPLKGLFDVTLNDDLAGKESFEKAESEMVKTVVNLAFQKADFMATDIDYLIGGDLLNQCSASTFGVRDLKVPFLGIYGACSTMAQGIVLSSVLATSSYAKNVACFASSHFCAAEKQFRYPLEYGGQRAKTCQWTVTGAGSLVVSTFGNGVKIKSASVGKICDLGITDSNNMGAAMAPAATRTLVDFFNETGKDPNEYDLIVTGDLAYEGVKLTRELAAQEGVFLGKNYTDCGLIIYDREKQDVHAGGSGCGCSAVVLTSFILPRMLAGVYKKVIFVGTGALMSPTTVLQKESIPGIAHLVELEY